MGGLEVDKEGKEPLSVCTFILPAVIIREGNGTPLQYSCLEDPMDRGAWRVIVHGVAKSQTRPSIQPLRYNTGYTLKLKRNFLFI